MFRELTRILCVKEESVYGSDPTPTIASNAIQAENIKVSYKGDVQERGIQQADISPVTPVMGKRWIEVSFDVEVKGSGSVGVAGKLGDMFEACGMLETASVGSSVVNTPNSGVMKSITMYVYDIPDTGSARLHKITGARGTFTLKMNAGQIAKLSFNFMGIYNAQTDVTPPGTPTFESTLPPIVQSASLTLNSVTSLIVQSLELNAGVGVEQSEDVNSAGGIKAFNIVKRNPTCKISPEAVTASTYDFRGDLISATERALSVVIGSVAGNKVTITAPKVTIDSVDDGGRNGVRTDEVGLRLNRNAGNDELVLTWQ